MLSIFNIYSLDAQIMVDITLLLSIIFGICVISSNNPMFSILYLIGLFISIAGYLYYIDLGIMSLLYLLIYVGAIAILFLFILSLLDIKLSELKAKSIRNDFTTIFIVTVVLFYSFYYYFNLNINLLDINCLIDYRLNPQFKELFSPAYGGTSADLGGSPLDLNSVNQVFYNVNSVPQNLSVVFTNSWFDIYSINELTSIGNLLYTEYAFLFFILGFILLLSIIGAIVVTTLK